jgi:hypothetical protein
MKAHIYSSIDAHSLLHELEHTAERMPDNFSRAEVPYHAASTKGGELHIAGLVEGKIAQHSEKILVASLDSDSSLDALTSKRRLGAFLGPLLKKYNETEKTNLAPDDQAIMIFEDDLEKAKQSSS